MNEEKTEKKIPQPELEVIRWPEEDIISCT